MAKTKEPLYVPKVKRAHNFIPPQLSYKDEGVPDTHISMYELFVSSPEARKNFGENVAEKIRKKTYNNVLELFDRCSARDYPSFWNLFIEEIKELRLNEFANFPEIEPLCSYIECFGTPHKTRVGKNKKELVSFGIRKQTLKDYYERKEEAENSGVEFIPPEYKRRGHPINKEFVLFGEALVFTSEKVKTTVPRNEIYNRFEHWRTIRGLSKREATLMALEAVVNLNETEGVGEVSDYKVETIFNKVIVKPNIKLNESSELHLTMDRGLKNQVKTIIQTYNNQPENKNSPPLNLSSYTQNALIMLNKKMGIKYSDPQLYEQKKKAEERKKATDEFFKKGGTIDAK